MMTILKRCSPIRPCCQFFTALAIIALLGVSHVALAQDVDRKIYLGTFCQPFRSVGEGQPIVEYDARGRILNLHPVEVLTVICPVVRDETMGTAGIMRATVRILAGIEPGGEFDAATLRCTLFSLTQFGDVVDFEAKSNVGMPRGNRVLFFENQLTSSDTNAPGAYLFRCNLPPRVGDRVSGIISYRVEEIITSNPQAESSLDEMNEE
jgi:hypothetical protein